MTEALRWEPAGMVEEQEGPCTVVCLTKRKKIESFRYYCCVTLFRDFTALSHNFYIKLIDSESPEFKPDLEDMVNCSLTMPGIWAGESPVGRGALRVAAGICWEFLYSFMPGARMGTSGWRLSSAGTAVHRIPHLGLLTQPDSRRTQQPQGGGADVFQGAKLRRPRLLRPSLGHDTAPLPPHLMDRAVSDLPGFKRRKTRWRMVHARPRRRRRKVEAAELQPLGSRMHHRARAGGDTACSAQQMPLGVMNKHVNE